MRCPETHSTDIQIIEICKLRKEIVLHTNSGRWKYGREPCCSHRHISKKRHEKNYNRDQQKGLNELCDWLAKYNCTDVCMESTGKYWIPVFNILEQHNLWVTLSHPKYTKPMKGNKTDRKDAKWICDLYMCGMVKPSFIPPADIRELRDLVRYRFKLTCMITGEKNRAQNCLQYLI